MIHRLQVHTQRICQVHLMELSRLGEYQEGVAQVAARCGALLGETCLQALISSDFLFCQNYAQRLDQTIGSSPRSSHHG